MRKVNTVYVTKYLLTSGFLETEAVRVSTIEGRTYVDTVDYPNGFFRLGTEVFLNRESALTRATELCQRKRESLLRSLKKIDKIKRDLGL